MDPRIRNVSRALLGGLYRLELADAVYEASDGRVFTFSLAARLGVREGQISGDLQHFLELKLLEKGLRDEGSRAQPYIRVDSDFWAGCAGLLKELRNRQDGDW